jgi:hypothetical protein
MWNNGKVINYGQITTANCRQRQKLFMLYLTTKSFSHQLQMLMELRVEEVYLFHVFLTTTINHLKYNRVYASNFIFLIHYFVMFTAMQK